MQQRIRNSNFFIKLSSWEYWPVYITNIPTVLFWLYFAVKSRDLFFFSVVNPAIETGGVLGESKINILNRLPLDSIPKTLFCKSTSSPLSEIIDKLKENEISFPIVAKPNIGERGFLVEKLNTSKELEQYLSRVSVDFIIQEYIDLPIEVSVLHYRFPGEETGVVTSICLKQNLQVVGDGKSTIYQLMRKDPRAKLQISRFLKEGKECLENVPSVNETVLLEPIGNHCRGTMFLNGNHFINPVLSHHFDELSTGLAGIYYGRFDLKCDSVEALGAGSKYKILEFNGVASEPAHIYDPTYSIWKAYRDIYNHWKIIYFISKRQKEKWRDLDESHGCETKSKVVLSVSPCSKEIVE